MRRWTIVVLAVIGALLLFPSCGPASAAFAALQANIEAYRDDVAGYQEAFLAGTMDPEAFADAIVGSNEKLWEGVEATLEEGRDQVLGMEWWELLLAIVGVQVPGLAGLNALRNRGRRLRGEPIGRPYVPTGAPPPG